MFDSAFVVLQSHFYDTTFVHARLKALREEFRPVAVSAASDTAELDVIRRFLSQIPASHLALLSTDEYEDLAYDLAGKRHLTLGMQLIRVDRRYFASMVLPGGPAFVAGVRQGDEIATIDGVPPELSPHLDWREDDVSLLDGRYPPTYGMRLLSSKWLDLQVVRAPEDTVTVSVTPRFYSALDATRASIQLFTLDSVRLGYIHWWYMQSRGVVDEFAAALDGPFAGSDALVLDLRGRGGYEHTVQGILELLTPGKQQRFKGPVVALIDRQTRSAKEELAYELRALGRGRLVGEPTAGAFIPAEFARLSHDAVLMYPITDKLPNRYTALIERHPIEPDVRAPWVGPYARGTDSIMAAGVAEAVRLVRTRRSIADSVRNW
jgi:tricorn protease